MTLGPEADLVLSRCPEEPLGQIRRLLVLLIHAPLEVAIILRFWLPKNVGLDDVRVMRITDLFLVFSKVLV